MTPPAADALLRALRDALAAPEPSADAAPEAALAAWRARIDAVDRAVCALLHERMRSAHAIGAVKRTLGAPVYAPRREEAVLANVLAVADGPIPPAVVRRLFERIIDETRTLERESVEREGGTHERGAHERGERPDGA